MEIGFELVLDAQYAISVPLRPRVDFRPVVSRASTSRPTGRDVPEADREDLFLAGCATVEGGTGSGMRIVEQVAASPDWTISVADGSDPDARFEFSGVAFRRSP